MSIDLFYSNTVLVMTKKELIKDFTFKLKSKEDNGERVLFVYDYLKTIRPTRPFPQIISTHKTESLSTYYRNLGNQCFIKKEYHKAWQYYNLSLLHSPLDSENYCISLSNRSAVFFALKKYDESLIDIDKIFSLNYPEFLKVKLNKRRNDCVQQLKSVKPDNKNKNDDFIDDIMSMKGPRHKRYPCASAKLDVVTDNGMGRSVFAKEDINVGEVLALEEPYLILLLQDKFIFYCNYCMSRKANLMPCSSCCYALYCSSECKEKAFKDYHEIECPLLATLMKMKFTKLELLALRTTIRARNDHENWNSLLKTVAEAEANMDTELRGCVKVDGEWIYDSKYYPSTHTLESNIEKRCVSDVYQKSVTAAVFYHFLKTYTSFVECESENEEEKEKIAHFVAGTLLLHSMTSPTNMHNIGTNTETVNGLFVEDLNIGSAPYSFLSLLNHSCAPNVVRFSELDTAKMRLYALRPIKKGMQLLDNYGWHHALHDREERNKNLLFQYKFSCACEACINDWPRYFRLGLARGLPNAISHRAKKILGSQNIEKLQKGSVCIAVNLYPELCRLAEVLEPYAPCQELANCQETLKQCMILMNGTVPREYADLVDCEAKDPYTVDQK